MRNTHQVLLVEDNPKDAMLVEQYMRESGLTLSLVRVDTEENYLKELDKDPDMVISDYSLPQFSGLRALELLKRSEKEIPFILISGTIGEEVAVDAMKLGANDYIMKHNLNRLAAAIIRELDEAKMRRQLKDVEEKYQKLVTLSPDAIFIQSEGNFVFSNQAGVDLLGAKSNRDIIGRSIFDFIHPDYHKIVQKRIQFSQEQDIVNDMLEEKFIDINGNVVDVEVLTAPFKFMNKPATQMYVRNISSRKRAEEHIKVQNIQLKKYIARNQRLKYADLMKSEFLATMSHELRTPMNAIIGFSEVLKDGLVGDLTSKQREYCSDIYKSGQHLLALINDILDLSKVDAGKMDCELEETDIEVVLKEAISLLKDKASIHNIDLKLEVETKLGAWKFDQRKLKQILFNLISNAIKFSPNATAVTLRAKINNEGMLEIAVSDKGEGIASEDLKRLFRPFEQIRQAHHSREKGTGLGLMMAKRLTELHSGSIDVESTLGKGTTFVLRFPQDSQGANGKGTMPELRDKKIFAPIALVIDDDPKAGELVGLQLKELGIEMIWKSSAEEALSSNYEEIPDLIILDILLPGISGIETLAQLKSHKVLSDIPVIIASIIANEHKSAIIDAVDVLQKPLGRHQLADSIRKYVKNNTPDQKIKILVADDDLASVELLKHSLEGMNCLITHAKDGVDALTLITEDQPDLVVLDLLMPRMNGFEVLDKLKRQVETANIPVIIITSKNLTDAELKMIRNNAIHMIQKDSFAEEQFREQIRRIVLE